MDKPSGGRFFLLFDKRELLLLIFALIYICVSAAISYTAGHLIDMNYEFSLFYVFRMGFSAGETAKYAAYLCLALYALPLSAALLLCLLESLLYNLYNAWAFLFFAALSFLMSALWFVIIVNKCFSQGRFRHE